MCSMKEERISIIPFDGTQKQWKVWSTKLLARARRKGYKEILTGTKLAPKDNVSRPLSTTDQALKDANMLAYKDIILSMDGSKATGRVAFRLVETSLAGMADGNAREAWKKLMDKYQPNRALNRVELKQEFVNLKLKDSNHNPDEWITELEELQADLARMGSDITDEDFYIHILNNIPKEYDMEVKLLEETLANVLTPLTLQQIRDELNLKYMRLKKREHLEGSNNNEGKGKEDTALFTNQFKGRCNYCGCMGHKAVQCNENPRNQRGRGRSFQRGG